MTSGRSFLTGPIETRAGPDIIYMGSSEYSNIKIIDSNSPLNMPRIKIDWLIEELVEKKNDLGQNLSSVRLSLGRVRRRKLFTQCKTLHGWRQVHDNLRHTSKAFPRRAQFDDKIERVKERCWPGTYYSGFSLTIAKKNIDLLKK